MRRARPAGIVPRTTTGASKMRRSRLSTTRSIVDELRSPMPLARHFGRAPSAGAGASANAVDSVESLGQDHGCSGLHPRDRPLE